MRIINIKTRFLFALLALTALPASYFIAIDVFYGRFNGVLELGMTLLTLFLIWVGLSAVFAVFSRSPTKTFQFVLQNTFWI